MPSRSVVVGAGVIGLSTATALADRGHQVTLVDRAEPGTGTSWTSFAWLNANSKHPRSYHELNVAGVAWYRRTFGDGRVPAWLDLRGRIQWASSEDGKIALETCVGAMRTWDYPVHPITHAEARKLEPDLAIPAGAEIRFWPSEGYLVPQLWIAELLAMAKARQVTFEIGAAVVGMSPAHQAIRVELEGGRTLQADTLVYCTGRWTDEAVGMIGLTLPMITDHVGGPTLGLLGYTCVSSSRLTRTVSGDDLNIRPDAPAGRYVLQAPDFDGSVQLTDEPSRDGPRARTMLERARRTLRGFDTTLDDLRVGHRAIPGDRLTICGWVPGAERVYAIATHSGYTLGPLLGELGAGEIDGAVDEGMLGDFRPSRFAFSRYQAGSTLGREF